MITYAQNFEDVILARLFAGQDSGFYIDIGAAHPSKLSVTRHFYNLGWHGVNVEPIRRNWELFILDRPRDINLNVAVGTRCGTLEFCEAINNDAMSSVDTGRISQLKTSGVKVKLYPVECVTGNSIFEQCPATVDFLKIDVEGAEDDVLRSIDLLRYQPRVLVIEATSTVDTFPGWESYSPDDYTNCDTWEPYVIDSGYRLVYFDGLNRFYVRSDLNHLAKRLTVPPGVFDFIIPDLENVMIKSRLESESAFKAALIAKEYAIQDLSRRLAIYTAIFSIPVFGGIMRLIKKSLDILRPRLGNLNQYAPRQLTVLPQSISINQLINTPKVSIVTPSFQQGAFIERTIQSVLDQQYPNMEYFVQDGGSKDDTAAILRRYEGKLTGWVSEKDSGQSQAINLGFAKTTGDIMAWLNSDDLLLPGSLAIVIDYFNKHPEVDVIYGNRLLIDENDMEIGRWILPGHDGEVLSWVDYIPQETIFWRRSIWDKLGGKIDESFRFAMDWDLLVRFREAGAKFAHIPYFLGAFRIHEQQKTSAVINEIGHHEMNRIRKRILGKVPDNKELLKAMLPYLIKHIVIDLVYRVKTRLGQKT